MHANLPTKVIKCATDQKGDDLKTIITKLETRGYLTLRKPRINSINQIEILFWWLVRVTIVVAWLFLPQNFGPMSHFQGGEIGGETGGETGGKTGSKTGSGDRE